MTITFGDADPEDEWDDVDPLRTKLAILERVVVSVRADSYRRHARVRDALRLVDKLWELVRGKDRHRLRRIEDDLEDLG